MTDLRRDGHENVEPKDLDPYDSSNNPYSPRRIQARAAELAKQDRKVITGEDLLEIDKQEDVKQKKNTESITCDQLDEKGQLKRQ